MTELNVPEAYRTLRSFSFGDSPALADELLALVLQGVKTATCSTEDEPNMSKPGERWIVLDGHGTPRCVIESVEVCFRRYDEVDSVFAHDEGEGDRGLSYWRAAHRSYFDRLGKFREDMVLMCERFRLVEVFPDRENHASVSAPVGSEIAPSTSTPTLSRNRDREQKPSAAKQRS